MTRRGVPGDLLVFQERFGADVYVIRRALQRSFSREGDNGTADSKGREEKQPQRVVIRWQLPRRCTGSEEIERERW